MDHVQVRGLRRLVPAARPGRVGPRRGDPERAPGILLLPALPERQRQVAVRPEADVGQPVAPVHRPHPQREVVVRDAEPALVPVHPRREQRDLETERGEQRPEGAVEFVAEPAPPRSHHLVQQPLLVQHDLLAEVDGEVLERHGPQMPQVQLAQHLRRGRDGAFGAQAAQVGIDPRCIHAPSLPRAATPRRGSPLRAAPATAAAAAGYAPVPEWRRNQARARLPADRRPDRRRHPRWPAQARAPAAPQRSFARRHGIAASTAGRVYAELVRRGLVVGEVGRGTFVRAAPVPSGRALAEPATTAPVNLELNYPTAPGQAGLLTPALAPLLRPDVLAEATRTARPRARRPLARRLPGCWRRPGGGPPPTRSSSAETPARRSPARWPHWSGRAAGWGSTP
ncbi:hypothetical protein SGRIM128S_02740 [Streptomyces griseomycini]